MCGDYNSMGGYRGQHVQQQNLKERDNLSYLGVDEIIILTLRRLMSYVYIYGAPILGVSRSHTTTQHSR